MEREEENEEEMGLQKLRRISRIIWAWDLAMGIGG